MGKNLKTNQNLDLLLTLMPMLGVVMVVMVIVVMVVTVMVVDVTTMEKGALMLMLTMVTLVLVTTVTVTLIMEVTMVVIWAKDLQMLMLNHGTTVMDMDILTAIVLMVVITGAKLTDQNSSHYMSTQNSTFFSQITLAMQLITF